MILSTAHAVAAGSSGSGSDIVVVVAEEGCTEDGHSIAFAYRTGQDFDEADYTTQRF